MADAATGELLYEERLDPTPDRIYASPVPLSGGSVLLRSDKYLYRLKPAN